MHSNLVKQRTGFGASEENECMDFWIDVIFCGTGTPGFGDTFE